MDNASLIEHIAVIFLEIIIVIFPISIFEHHCKYASLMVPAKNRFQTENRNTITKPLSIAMLMFAYRLSKSRLPVQCMTV